MEYQNPGPTREEVDNLSGLAVIQFGSEWCGFCQAAETSIQQSLAARKDIKLIKVEDGPGRRLGRSFRVKLWPTLIVLKDGAEVGRVVRPESVEQIDEELKKIS